MVGGDALLAAVATRNKASDLPTSGRLLLMVPLLLKKGLLLLVLLARPEGHRSAGSG